MAASAADMHPICQRFADQEVPAKFPAQYICFSEHSKGSGGFCLSMLEWYTNGELWSSAYDIGSGTNDAEQAPIILANRRGSLLDDTVKPLPKCGDEHTFSAYVQRKCSDTSISSARTFSHGFVSLSFLVTG